MTVAFSLVDVGVLVERVGGVPPLKGRLAGAGLLKALEAEHRDEVARGR